MAKAKTKKKDKNPGAQPGNKNALKHGFYANKFTAEETKRLDTQGDLTVTDEITALRICLDRLLKEISFDERTKTDAQLNRIRDDHYLHQLNTLSSIAQAIGTLKRTDYLIRGKSEGIQQSILEALELVRLDLGI